MRSAYLDNGEGIMTNKSVGAAIATIVLILSTLLYAQAESPPLTRRVSERMILPDITAADFVGGAWGVSVSEDLSHIAHVAVVGDKQAVFIDGQQTSAPYDEVRLGVFNPDGQLIGYEARMGDKWFWVLDGKEGPRYDSLLYDQLSPDGKRLAYSAKLGDKLVVVVDGEQSELFEYRLESGIPKFSSDSQRVAYNIRSGETKFAVVDGRAYDYFDRSWFAGFSPDGRRSAIGADMGDRRFVLIDDQAYDEYDISWLVGCPGRIFCYHLPDW